MHHMRLKIASLVVVALVSIQVAAAWDWGPVVAHVTMIDPGQMGSPAGSVAVYLKVDQDAGACGSTGCCANTWLYYSPAAFTGTSPVDNDRQMVNAKAILTTAQISLVTGKNIQIYGLNNGGSGFCQLQYVQSLNY
jgi:hypothetical protein